MGAQIRKTLTVVVVGMLAAAGSTTASAQNGTTPAPHFPSTSLVSPQPDFNTFSTTRVLIRVSPGTRLVTDPAAEHFWLQTASPTPSSPSSLIPLAAVLTGLSGWTLGPALSTPPANAALASSLGLDRDLLLTFAGPTDTWDVAHRLAALPGIESAMPEPIGHLLDAQAELRLPSDPLVPQQYALNNTAQSIQGVVGVIGADVRAFPAWLRIGATSPVTVAVIDSGVASTHPDLAIAMVPGWNVTNNTNATFDEISSHGTHLAGIIGAVHNTIGIAGLCPNARIMPVKVTNTFGSTGAAWVASGITWAADNGARVLNVSIGFTADNTTLRSAVQYAVARGCLVVCSAGNVPTSPIVFPARYEEAIAVGATDNRDAIWSSSASGPELDLVAPGVNVLSTYHKTATPNSYAYQSGTSQAAPQVAGIAALIWSVAPSLNSWQVRLILESSVRDLGVPGRDPVFGFGRIDAGRAVELAYSFVAPTTPFQGSCRVDLNHDGVVSSADFFIYMQWYIAADPRADFAPPVGVISGEDFFQFSLEYSRGCLL